MPKQKTTVKKRIYEGWIVDPKTKGYDLVSRSTNRQQCFLETTYTAGKRGAKQLFIEDANGKKTWFKK